MNLIQKQIEYENTYGKHQLRQLLRRVYVSVLTDEINELHDMSDLILSEQDRITFSNYIDKLIQIIAIVGEKKSIYMSSLITMLSERMEDEDVEQIIKLINHCINRKYIKAVKGKTYIQIKAMYEVSEDIQKQIDKFKYLNPMLVEPLPVNHKGNNRGSGYLTVGSDSLILGGIRHKEFINTNVLNKLNSIPLSLNQDVIYTYRNEWRNLDKPKENETNDEYDKRISDFERYEQGCYDTFAQMINNGNKFYLTHKYDKRGRGYCQGYFISYQGNSYAKAVLELSNKEITDNEVHFY